MSRDYPESVIKDQARGMLQNDPHFFYTQNILNYRGNTLDTKRPYSEVIAEELLNSYQEIKKIGKNIQIRKKTFKASHKGIPSVEARLRRFGNLKFSEKLLAIALNNSDANYCFGKILDYEVPLKETRIDKFGKIDLIALEESTHSIKLVELKIRKTEGTDETLLRAILEIYTYYKLIVNSLNKFLKDYELSNHEYSHFQPAVLTDEKSLSGRTITDIDNYPKLKEFLLKISDEIGVNMEFFVYDYENRGKPFRFLDESKRIDLPGNIMIRKILLQS